MRLAFCLFKYFPFGGLQQDFMQIAEACLRQGHEISVFTMDWQGEMHAYLPVTLLPGRGWTNHQRCWHFAQQLSGYLTHFDCVVGFNKMPGLDVYYAADSCFKARLAQKSWLYSFSPRSRTYLNLEQAVLGSQAKTHCLLLTEQQKADFKQYYYTPDTRLHLLPPSVSLAFIPPENTGEQRKAVRKLWSIPENAHLILMVASYFHTKGVDRSIAALASLPASLRDKTHLLIIGQDNSSAYAHMAKRLHCERQVHFIGARTDVARFMWAADLLLHPARNEAGGKVLLEALTAGLPILTTANCGYANHIQQAKAGMVLPSEYDQSGLDKSLAAILADTDLLNRFKQQAKQYAAQADWFNMPQRVIEWIEQCKSS